MDVLIESAQWIWILESPDYKIHISVTHKYIPQVYRGIIRLYILIEFTWIPGNCMLSLYTYIRECEDAVWYSEVNDDNIKAVRAALELKMLYGVFQNSVLLLFQSNHINFIHMHVQPSLF